MILIYGIIKCYQALVIWNKWLYIIFVPLWTFFVFLLVLFLQQYTFFSFTVIVIKYFANIYCL